MVTDMALAFTMRFLHIFSAVALAGGLLGWRFATQAAVNAAAPDKRSALSDAAAAAWRPLALFSVAAILVSGIYAASNAGARSTAYHAALGIKILLALHVVAVVVLATRPANPKRARLLTGAAWSACAVVAIAVLLRTL